MTDYQHPITPPPELVQQWLYASPTRDPHVHVATQAARWGADQELEACVEWLQDPDLNVDTYKLRAARRPKPMGLKEEALAVLMNADGADHPSPLLVLPADDVATIRRALESLPD